jgi:hypothetical protein
VCYKLIDLGTAVRVCAYHLNAKKRNKLRRHTKKFAANYRYYFTSAKICQILSISKSEVKEQVASQPFTGMLKMEQIEERVMSEPKEEETPKDPEERVLTTRMIDSNRDKI